MIQTEMSGEGFQRTTLPLKPIDIGPAYTQLRLWDPIKLPQSILDMHPTDRDVESPWYHYSHSGLTEYIIAMFDFFEAADIDVFFTEREIPVTVLSVPAGYVSRIHPSSTYLTCLHQLVKIIFGLMSIEPHADSRFEPLDEVLKKNIVGFREHLLWLLDTDEKWSLKKRLIGLKCSATAYLHARKTLLEV
jgi:hypothetical protein